MKTYLIKTTHRNIYGEITDTRLEPKEYKSLAIAKRYLKAGLEQTIVERTTLFRNHRKFYVKDVELKNE